MEPEEGLNHGCIVVLMADPLNDTIVSILKRYSYNCSMLSEFFSIRKEKFNPQGPPPRPKYVLRKLRKVFGGLPMTQLVICGESTLIFFAAHEIIKHFGGYLFLPTSDDRQHMKKLPGISIEILRPGRKDPTDPDDSSDYLLNHTAIYKWLDFESKNMEKEFSLDRFLTIA